MSELVIYPDSEAVLIAYLRQALTGTQFDGAHIGTKTAAGSGNTLTTPAAVLVSLIGGSETVRTLESLTFNIDTRDEDPERASLLGATVRAHMAVMPWECVHANVLGVTETTRPVPFPDPLTGAPSYRQQHQLRIRGTAA